MSDLKSAAQRVAEMLKVRMEDDGYGCYVLRIIYQEGDGRRTDFFPAAEHQYHAFDALEEALADLRTALGDGDAI